MKLSEVVKPISYLKAHASEIIREMGHMKETMIITQNGEAKAVLLDIQQYEQMQNSLDLLKMLAQSSHSLKKGKTKPYKRAFEDTYKKIKEHQNQ